MFHVCHLLMFFFNFTRCICIFLSLYFQLLQYDFEDIEATFCNETRLAVFLNTTSPTVTVSNISTSLCGIGQDKVVNLTEYLLKTLDVGDLVKKV